MFVHEEVVRFGHVDAAGIVFFPRLHEMLSNTVEAWFEQALDAPWTRLHLEAGLGTPLVHSEVSYRRGCRLGDRLAFSLALVKVGRSSFDLRIVARCGDEVRLEAAQRHAFVRLAPLGSVAIPDAVRGRMTGFLAT